MTATNIFGNIVRRDQVEQGVLDTVEKWIDTYLCEVERNAGLTVRSLPRPKSFERENSFNLEPDDQLPAIKIVSPGTGSKPIKASRGQYRSYWNISVTVVAVSTPDSVRDLAGYYVAAIRTLLLQHQDLGGIGAGIDWTGDKYDDEPDPFRRTVASGSVQLEVEVDNVLTSAAGPVTPNPIPDPTPEPGNWPEVIHTSVIVTKENA